MVRLNFFVLHRKLPVYGVRVDMRQIILVYLHIPIALDVTGAA